MSARVTNAYSRIDAWSLFICSILNAAREAGFLGIGILSGSILYREDHADLPIVVLTGVDDAEFSRRVVREGAQDYLVKDEGCGMAESELGRACDPFYTTKPLGAVGLGLSAAEDFVKQCGGHLELESGVGIGTRVCLPRASAPCTVA